MKKILFLTVRDPFSGRFSGDVIRSKKFVEYFAKKNNVQVLALGKNNSLKNSKRLSVRLFKNENFFIILFRCLISLLRSKPLHLNFFYSSALKRYLKLNIKSYDLIFCQSIRSFQYLPEIKKNIILDVGDLYSKNYYQTYKNLFFFNPLKFIYYIESKLVKKYEQLCFSKSNKILLFSKKEIQEIKNVPKNKKIQINFGIDKIKKIYRDDDGHMTDEQREGIAKELGDCLWYFAQLATDLGVSLDVIARGDIAKLSSRKERGVLGGSGDNR